ncbi:MAG: bifunctional nicotinamidase/pyrazinamidase [Spirochaetales bacterium]|nr:MAG: bifunctional nicotinamidase/pyrazinamidase [Spirochaetales bacterium]
MKLNPERAAFVAVDIQNDFCPGGALAVSGGDQIVPLINSLARRFQTAVASQDWHPAGHVSFASSHPGKHPYDSDDATGRALTLWPDHCVQGTPGAELHPLLDEGPYRLIVRKGFRHGLDSYSVFFENDGKTPTGLEGYLRGLSIDTVVLAGLALDYCVFFSALDASALGFSVVVVRDATRAVDVPEGNADRVVADMISRGIAVISIKELA